ncbi:MAG: ABC transporter permease [Ruminococcaceae bacterium]|nr:ABC transporter permease [Oscillospiraceae bacterium]
MKRFLFLQLKRMLRFMPLVIAVTLCLLLGLSVFISGIVSYFDDSEEKKPLYIGVTGDTENEYMQIGIAAVKSLDDTRFSIVFEEMSESDAEKAIASGNISAYIVFPEDFIDKALSGDIERIEFVTSSGASDITTLFKNEITMIITDMMIASEKGTYGINDAMDENGLSKESLEAMEKISSYYVNMIFNRSKVYETKEIGFANGLDMMDYFVCGITVLLIFMMGLPYAIVYVKKDYSLSRLLLSRSHSCLRQLLCEYISHLAAMFSLVVTVFVFLGITKNSFGTLSSIFDISLLTFILRLLPVIIMISAFNIFAFELADNIVSGMLIHFFTCLCMCYIAGCMYPIYTFPVVLQKISAFLPAGLAVNWLSGNFTGDFHLMSLSGILIYSLLFFSASLFVRKQKTSNKQKGGTV